MNLSMIFLVLSTFIAFLLYDMFKKSRQQQELAQAHTTQKKSQNKLRPNYEAECSILHQMHEAKLDSVKHKNLSIHLEEENLIPDFSTANKTHVIGIIKSLLQTHNVYLLVCRKKMVRNQLVEAIRMGGATEIGFETIEGGVAVLRQLNCSTHLEGNLALSSIIQQYLSVVWLASPQKQEATFAFRNELEMILNLQLSIKKGKELKEE